jgi:hypothetical protein
MQKSAVLNRMCNLKKLQLIRALKLLAFGGIFLFKRKEVAGE